MLVGRRLARFARAAAVVAAATAAACSPGPRSSRLLEVTDVSPRTFEAGEALRLTGDGFPIGREARVRFEGWVHESGGSSERTAFEARGVVRSATLVEVPSTRAFALAMTHGGTFDGRIVVSFAAGVDSIDEVVGVFDRARLDVSAPIEPHLAEQLRREREGLELARHLGLTLRDDADRSNGLGVQRVDVDSLAAVAGVRDGDRIVRVGGVRADSLADLAVREPGEALAVTIDRAGMRAPVEVAVSTVGWDARVQRDRTLVASITLVALTLWLAWFVPWRVALVRWRAVRAPSERRGARALIVTALAMAIAVVPFASTLLGRSIDALVVWSATVVLGAAGVGLGDRRRTPRAEGAGLAEWWIEKLAADVPIAIAMIGATLYAGTRKLDEVVAGQGTWPWQWAAVRNPAVLVLAAALVVGAARTRPPGYSGIRDRRWAGYAHSLRLLLFAASAAALFFGGWATPATFGEHVLGAALADAIGAVAYASKVALLWWVLAGVEATPLERRSVGWSVVSVLAATAATVSPMVSTAAPVEAAFGPAACVVGAILLGRHWARLAGARPEPRVRVAAYL